MQSASCHGKQQLSFKAARTIVNRMNKAGKGHLKRYKAVASYHCKLCGHWHVTDRLKSWNRLQTRKRLSP